MQKLWDKKALLLNQILDGQVRLVGGCVRDYLLHKKFEDRDMATTLTPNEVVQRLKKHKIPYLEIGRAFGTIVAKVDGTPFEITTLRKDIETDGRHAVVGFTKSWAVDARRRDFTINALYADVKGKIYDYVGGISDLNANRLRFIGPALKRMQEDYLRLLRYFRFWAKTRAKKIDTDIVKALPKIIPQIPTLSVDRRRDELFKIVTGPRAKTTLNMMKKYGVLNKNLLDISFSKRQRNLIAQKGLEMMLASFSFSGYKGNKGD
ncbi:MAG: CCA tRNA nucleotidyltransferase [Alphaproteobacteria bacterium]|nr:CCA tRNA nucleotidyltransferase [Alphaproteobacteria bacterium]